MTTARTDRPPVVRREGAPAGPRAAAFPGILIGAGLGAFVDGVLIHQILQWHHMRSGDGAAGGESLGTVAGLEANTLADGLFHAAAWVAVLVGVVLLWRRAPGPRASARDGRRLAGLLVLGWGLFNLAEGLVNHHLLRVHHVRDDLGGPVEWDLGFLAVSAGLVVAGRLLAGPLRGAGDGVSPSGRR